MTKEYFIIEQLQNSYSKAILLDKLNDGWAIEGNSKFLGENTMLLSKRGPHGTSICEKCQRVTFKHSEDQK